MSFLIALWRILTGLLWMPAALLFGMLLCLIAVWSNRREEEAPPEPITELWPPLPRYAREVCEILRQVEERERQADNL